MKKRLWIALLGLALVASSALTLFAGPGLSKGDQKFLTEAANGGTMEVQFGQLAQAKAQSPDVKKFGTRMVTDHGKGGQELKALAQQKGLTLAAPREGKLKTDVAKLSSLAGGDFDRMYISMMVKDHLKDVADFRRATANVKDSDLNAWAVKTLPILERQLQLANEIALKLGIKSQ
jgi:putative membrane protein